MPLYIKFIHNSKAILPFLLTIISTIQATKNYLSDLKKAGKTIGFVPTMGALHKGHASLLEKAKTENNISVSSIFVNPLQFNDKKDLEKYPRNLEKDIEALKKTHCDMLFAPSAEEMYPASTGSRSAFTTPVYDPGPLGNVMEGKYRPGHFQGVCTVVKRLFDIIEPDKAYFGEKDFQQLTIIRHMVKSHRIPVELIACPTVREPDGLAMSSRNMLLTPDERKNAPHIYKVLSEVKEKGKNTPVSDLKNWAEKKISENPLFQLDYFEIIDSETLLPVSSWTGTKSIRACVAVKVGAVRLIDNMPL